MAENLEEDVDEKEYEYSEEKRAKLLGKAGILNEVNSIEQMLDNEDPFTLEESEIKKLCIFIRNYDSEGNLVVSPSDAVKTCIDTFEKSILKVTWKEQEEYTRDDGTIGYRMKKRIQYKDGADSSIFADPEILKVKPFIIESTTFVGNYIRQYFDNFNINKNKGGKTLFIEYHMTTNDVKFYDLSDADIDYFYRKNYDLIGLKLDNKEIEFKTSNLLLECTSLSFEDCTFKISSDTGISFKVDNLYLNNITIDSNYTKTLSSISCTVNKEVDIKYISFKNEMCKFNFLNSDMKDMQKWMQSSVKIYGIEFLNSEKSYEFTRDSLFTFKGFYKVDFSGLNLSFDTIDMHIIKFENISELNLGSHNIQANYFKKHLIVLRSITDLIACSIYATQKLSERSTVYLFHSSGGGLMGEHKYTALVTTNIGVISSTDDNNESVSFNNIRCNGFSKPIKWIGGGVTKLILSSCKFDSLADLSFSFPKISIFDSNFTKINKMNFVASNKIYISNSSFNGDDLILQTLNGSSILSDFCKFNFKNINIEGETGSGNVKFVKCDIKSNTMNYTSMNKITSEDTSYKVREMSIVGNNVTNFSPVFDDGFIKTVTVKGNIRNSLFTINNENSSTVNINTDSCKGNFNIISTNKTADLNLSMNISQVEIQIDSLEENVDNKINLTCKENCLGSILTSLKENYKFVPKAEGDFVSLKQFKYTDNLNLKTKEWKEKIAYGYKTM